ncbi:MAG: hypothetical protein AAGF12_21830 [Myxococcota bacterium]
MYRLDSSEITTDAENARRSAIVALEAAERVLEESPDLDKALTLMLPHLHLVPCELQQAALEAGTPRTFLQSIAVGLSVERP